jgi:hypothetical protein
MTRFQWYVDLLKFFTKDFLFSNELSAGAGFGGVNFLVGCASFYSSDSLR